MVLLQRDPPPTTQIPTYWHFNGAIFPWGSVCLTHSFSEIGVNSSFRRFPSFFILSPTIGTTHPPIQLQSVSLNISIACIGPVPYWRRNPSRCTWTCGPCSPVPTLRADLVVWQMVHANMHNPRFHAESSFCQPFGSSSYHHLQPLMANCPFYFNLPPPTSITTSSQMRR